jgi:hypothetical protein
MPDFSYLLKVDGSTFLPFIEILLDFGLESGLLRL